MIMKRKLGLSGHVCRIRDDRVIRTAMFGMVDGTRKKGGHWDVGLVTSENGLE